MHSGDLTALGGVELTDAEREALLEVMQRAKVQWNCVLNVAVTADIHSSLRTLMIRLISRSIGGTYIQLYYIIHGPSSDALWRVHAVDWRGSSTSGLML